MPTVDQSYDPAVPLDALTPSPVNPNESDVGAISTSIEANGFYGAVLASRDGTIIAGEHRWRAAAAVGEPTVPVLFAAVDAPTARRILLADNRTAELARRDEAKLADLLRSVVEDAGSVDALIGTGYDGDDLDQLLAHIGANSDGDDHWYGATERTDPVTRRGDLWLLGEHRLVCGDATDPRAYDAVLNGETAQLCLTDPPYGAGVDYGDEFSDDEETVGTLVDAFVPLVRARAKVVLLTPGRWLLWRYPRGDWLLNWVEPAGTGSGPWGFICSQPVIAYGGDPHLAAGLGRHPDTYIGEGAARDEDVERDHPVSKPIVPWSWFLERGSTRRGDLILDPFAGSGSTLIAAHHLDRHCALVEINPAYCDVICERFQRHTGLIPIRDGAEVNFTASGILSP